MDVTRYGAEIAAIVGLFTIAGFLWRIFKRLGTTMRVVTTLPAQLEETNKKLDGAVNKIEGVDKKVDLMAVQHLATTEQTHNSLGELKQAHIAFDDRIRKVEQGVGILMDRKERQERHDA